MRTAVIGIGSNSVRMLLADVADGRGKRLRREREVTRLFAGLDEAGRLSADAIVKTAATVKEMTLHAQAAGAGTLHIFATSATRDAANGGELAELDRKSVM